MPRDQRIVCNGPRLRELREDLEISIRDLAQKANVDAKTIIDLEHGRRSWVYPKTLKNVAAALSALGGTDVDWAKLRARSAPPKPRPSRIADELPPRSSLDKYVSAERRAGLQPMMETDDGPISPFGAAQLVEVFTAYAAHAGERYYVDGEITSQRGLRYSDCHVLAIPHATGARFEIARRIPGIARPFLLTVVTLDETRTRSLQKYAATGERVRAIVRVVAAKDAPGEDDRVVIVGLSGGEQLRSRRYRGELWVGFEQIEEKKEGAKQKAHPWALIVDEIVRWASCMTIF